MITWCFFGQEGVRALTPQESGTNLPSQFAPWTKFKIFDLRIDAPADMEALTAIGEHGFYLFEKDEPPLEPRPDRE